MRRRVLVDYSVILNAFIYKNEHTPDAEMLLTDIMPSEQIELYITELSLGKIRSLGKDAIANRIEEENFRIIKFHNCLDREQIFEFMRTGELCALEVHCALANNIRTVVTHKPEDFCSFDLTDAWTVNDLRDWLNDLPVLTETEIDFYRVKVLRSPAYANPSPAYANPIKSPPATNPESHSTNPESHNHPRNPESHHKNKKKITIKAKLLHRNIKKH